MFKIYKLFFFCGKGRFSICKIKRKYICFKREFFIESGEKRMVN